MTSKNNGAPLLYYIKHCASFQSHQWIQTGITARKCSIRVIIGELFFCVILKFGGWPWKSIGHLSYTTSIFEHHLKKFKLEWQSGNAQLGSKSAIVWPRDLEIWRMTLMNNRATLLFHIKHCASFQSRRWIQTGVTVRKRSNRVEIGNFLSHVTLKFDWWHWKTIGHLFYATSSFVHHFIAIGEFKLGVTVRKRPIWDKISNFLSCVTLKFGGWPWRTIGHLFYATSSVVHHSEAICEFKLELQSGKG